MSIGSMAAFACGVSSATPAYYDIETLKQIFSLGQCEGYGQAVTLKDSEPYPNIEDQFTAQFTMPFTREFGSTTEHYTVQMDLLNYPLKVILNSVENCSENLPSSLYVNDRTISKEDFISQYGNKLILDIANLPGQLTTRNLNTICIQGQNGLASSNLPITLRFNYNGQKGYCPLSMGLKTSNYYAEDMRTFGGKTMLWYAAGTDCLDLYLAYLNNSLSITTWNDAKKYGNSDYLKKVEFSDYQYSFLFDKEIVDNIIQDLNAAGIDINYYESSLSPLQAAKLTTCTLSGINSISPAFVSDTFTYTVNTSNAVIRVQAQGNTDTTYISYKVDEETYQGTIQPYLDHTFTGLSIGLHTIKIKANGPNPSEYTFNITVSNSEQTEPGQADNVHHNEGGSGTTIRDPIYIPSNVYSGYGLGRHTYLLDIVQATAIIDAFNKTNIYQTLTNLDLNNIISINLWPFKLDTTNANINSGIYIGKTAIEYAAPITGLPNGHDFSFEIDGDCQCILNFGNLDINEYFGGFLDYEPYTQFQLFLPYCGIVTVKTDDIMGHNVNLALVCDLETGTGEYLLSVNYTANVEGTPTQAWAYKYKWPCQISKTIQITGVNQAQLQNSIIKNVGAMAAGEAIAGEAGAIMGALGSLHSIANEFPRASAGSQGDGVERYGPQQPYFIITRPDTRVPDDYNKNFGRPSLITKQLTELSGFTQIPNPIINCNATQEEKDYIINALKEGVYI